MGLKRKNNVVQVNGYAMRCPHCQNEIYRINLGPNGYYYGTPFRKCSFCGKEYIDENYHEMAITGIRDCDKKKPLLKGDGDNIPFEAGSIERERAASEHRLMTSGYPLKLLSLSSVKKSTVLTRNINKYLLSELVPYIDLLWKKLNIFFQDFKVQNANSFFDRLTYEARDPNAVKHLTRQILEHYRLDSTNIVVDVKYTERRSGDPVRNRGSFSFHKSTPGGRIQIVIDSLYSEYDTVIAIALHECAHAFLREHGIELKTELENERLTDIAAIFLGGGNYLLRGYYCFHGFYIGYLEENECKLLVDTITDRRTKWLRDNMKTLEEEIDKISRLMSELSAQLPKIESLLTTVHPGRVLREESIQQTLEAAWNSWDEVSRRAKRMIEKNARLGLQDHTNYKKNIREAIKIKEKVDSFSAMLEEWVQAEKWQSMQHKDVIATNRGIEALEHQGNAFAILERIKFWAACPATLKDAIIYYKLLENRDDKDSICALGICSLKGIVVKKNRNKALLQLKRAADMGSMDAISLLRTCEDSVEQ